MHEDLPSLGSTVGPWRILTRLDSGSYGVVFRAQGADLPASPPVALKIARLPEDPRFERETEALQHSHHPSIPRYEGAGVWTSSTGEHYPYLVMEAVEGPTLYEWFRQQPRSSWDVLQVVAQLAGALASAHERGVIHRDIKGDNIRVTSEGRSVLLDWGSCWLPAARPLTDTPMPPGTSAYRPPEQRGFVYATSKSFDARWVSRPSDDLYALGVTLYRLVTGTYLPPCTDGISLVKREVLKPSALATVSSELEALILRLLSDDRGARGTAEQLVHEATKLVQAGGSEAQQPILPLISESLSVKGSTSSAPLSSDEALSDTDPAPRKIQSWRLSVSPGWARLCVVGCAAAAFLFLVVGPEPKRPPSPWLTLPEEVTQFAPDAGVAEEVSSIQDVPKAALPALLSLSRPMPKNPMRGQRKPPCERGETAINGACWVEVAREVPPCGDTMFDYDGRCFKASTDAPRQPTSDQP
jgi:serine/threonine protein kinase